MIVLLGSSGYVGSEFVRLFERRGVDYTALPYHEIDLYDPNLVADRLRQLRARFLINCAGYTGKPNVDACEQHRDECLLGNAVLPGRLAAACEIAEIPWGHVSSGCIYTGLKADGSGFDETDPPNFSFRQNNCSSYSGCKALGEECIADAAQCYVWRLRIPFDHRDSSRNYLSKVMRYSRLLDARNSLSHLGHFVAACFDCFDRKLPYGIYNLTNTGSVTTREVVDLILESGVCDKEFDFFADEEEFMRLAAKTPRSNTVLDNSKALSHGLHLPPVQDVIRQTLRDWEPEAVLS